MAGTNIKKSMRNYQILGLFVLIFGVGGVGTWSMMSSIQGAIIVSGVTVIEGYSKKIQHNEGGIVTAIAIKDGARVEAGDLLITLDKTAIAAQMSILNGVIVEKLAKAARLKSMRDGRDAIDFPEEVLGQKDDPHVKEITIDQRNLLKSLLDAHTSRSSQLDERILQTREEIVGINAQLEALIKQSKLIAEELEAIEALFKKGLVNKTRLLNLQREQAILVGTQGELVAKIARARGRISEIKLQIIQIKDEYRSNTLGELRTVESALTELREQRLAIRVKMDRAVIRAPQSGFIHQLKIHTIAGVIGAGEVIMHIVPDYQNLVIEAKVDPKDIDQLQINQPARLRFSAFSQRTTPEILGKVSFLSADLQNVDNNTAPYYLIKIKASDTELKRLGDKKLIPGMPVEAFIQTSARSPMNYLLKPLRDQIMRAFREE